MVSGEGIMGSITKKLLGHKNYTTRKHHMFSFVYLNDLWKHVDHFVIGKDATKIIDFGAKLNSDVDFNVEYQSKMQITFGFLSLSISRSIILDIKETTTPKKMWDIIINLYRHKDNMKAMNLQSQLEFEDNRHYDGIHENYETYTRSTNDNSWDRT